MSYSKHHEFPDEVWDLIKQSLTAGELVACSRVCKSWEEHFTPFGSRSNLATADHNRRLILRKHSLGSDSYTEADFLKVIPTIEAHHTGRPASYWHHVESDSDWWGPDLRPQLKSHRLCYCTHSGLNVLDLATRSTKRVSILSFQLFALTSRFVAYMEPDDLTIVQFYRRKRCTIRIPRTSRYGNIISNRMPAMSADGPYVVLARELPNRDWEVIVMKISGEVTERREAFVDCQEKIGTVLVQEHICTLFIINDMVRIFHIDLEKLTVGWSSSRSTQPMYDPDKRFHRLAADSTGDGWRLSLYTSTSCSTLCDYDMVWSPAVDHYRSGAIWKGTAYVPDTTGELAVIRTRTGAMIGGDPLVRAFLLVNDRYLIANQETSKWHSESSFLVFSFAQQDNMAPLLSDRNQPAFWWPAVAQLDQRMPRVVTLEELTAADSDDKIEVYGEHISGCGLAVDYQQKEK